MHVLINELSFQAQANNYKHAHRLTDDLTSIIKGIQPVRNGDPLCTSETIWKKEIMAGHTVSQFINSMGKDKLLWFRILMTKGPYVETLLDEALAYHECYFNGNDVSTTSLAGAVFYNGILASLQETSQFSSLLLRICFSEDGKLKTSEVINLFDPNAVTTIVEKLHKDMLNGITSWDDFWQKKTSLFSEIQFCDCIREHLSKMDFSPTNIKIIKDHLLKMNEYCKNFKNDKFVPDYTKMGICASIESEITLYHFGHQRTFFCPDGKKRTFSWHSKQFGQNLRIHFYPPDEDNKTFLIGYIGKHLDTYQYH